MIESNIYVDDIIDIIRKDKLIPRKLKSNEKLKLFHKYYIPVYGVIKVEEIFNNDGIDYYIIYFDNKYACIPYPLDDYKDCYELLIDYNKIYKSNIINNNIYYTGAEIKYWFTKDGKLLNSKYLGFANKYLVRNTKSELIDNKKYTIINIKNKYDAIEEL